ncbi:MAG: tannase/feruloyl esterase family alpha/beta hydrolase [Acidobacteria bacterium]|nr:tannase/feruloyl esterase family alpha/beta hydrolase [Acidobacteriota bacterium]
MIVISRTQIQREPAVNASSPDLSAFRTRGGKILMYSGWADPSRPPTDALDLLQASLGSCGRKATERIILRTLFPGAKSLSFSTIFTCDSGTNCMYRSVVVEIRECRISPWASFASAPARLSQTTGEARRFASSPTAYLSLAAGLMNRERVLLSRIGLPSRTV